MEEKTLSWEKTLNRVEWEANAMTRLRSLEEAWQSVEETNRNITKLMSPQDPESVRPERQEMTIVDMIVEQDQGPPVGMILPAWKVRQMARDEKRKQEFDAAKAEAEAQERQMRAPPPSTLPLITNEEFEILLDTLEVPPEQRPTMRAFDNEKKHKLKEAAAMQSGPKISSEKKKGKKKLSLAGLFGWKGKQAATSNSLRSSGSSESSQGIQPMSPLLAESVESEAQDDVDLEIPPEIVVPAWKQNQQHHIEKMNADALEARKEMLAGSAHQPSVEAQNDGELEMPPGIVVPEWKKNQQHQIERMEAVALDARNEMLASSAHQPLDELQDDLLVPPDVVIPEWKRHQQQQFEKMEAEVLEARKEMLASSIPEPSPSDDISENDLLMPPKVVVPEWKLQNQQQFSLMEARAREARQQTLSAGESKTSEILDGLIEGIVDELICLATTKASEVSNKSQEPNSSISDQAIIETISTHTDRSGKSQESNEENRPAVGINSNQPTTNKMRKASTGKASTKSPSTRRISQPISKAPIQAKPRIGASLSQSPKPTVTTSASSKRPFGRATPVGTVSTSKPRQVSDRGSQFRK